MQADDQRARFRAGARAAAKSMCSRPPLTHIKSLQAAEQARDCGGVDRRLGRADGRGAGRSRARRHAPCRRLARCAEAACERRGCGRAGSRARLRSAGLRHRRRAGHSGRPHGARAQARPSARRISWPKRRASRRAISSPISSTASAAISGLQTIDVLDAPHDCLELQYDGGKLFLPVENIELLTRYGADDATAQLDRLGGAGWQKPQGAHEGEGARDRGGADPHCGRAPVEGDRCRRSIRRKASMTNSAPAFPIRRRTTRRKPSPRSIEDLAKGRPMDRLVCGDVGFGKTEVALRAAFVEAMSGEQVAVVVPTTLLARQHFQTFSRAFQRLPAEDSPALALRGCEGCARNQGGACDRRRRHRDRHACAAGRRASSSRIWAS